LNDRLKEAFDNIHAEEQLKIRTQNYVALKTSGRKKSLFWLRRRFATAMACLFIVLVSLAGGSFLYFTPTSAISVDVNPSVELEINRFDRVISVKGYGKDGETLAASLDLRFLDYEKALEHLLTDTGLSKYVEQGQLVTVTVTGKSEAKSEKMLATVTSCTASMRDSSNISCACGNYEEMSTAHAAGMSFGKYRAFLELKKLNPDIKEEDVRNLTMRQIRDMINALSEDANNEDKSENDYTQENNNTGNAQENGSSNTNGSGQGCENGNGNGQGYGNGNGRGYGNGQGYGNGNGQGYGNCNGNGMHHGHGHHNN